MRIKKIICIISITLGSVVAFGQVNYVLNYSFEQHTNCGGILGCSVGSGVNNWISPEGFVDWFSFPCYGASAIFGVPQNDFGYQYARTGQCYGAISVIGTGNNDGYITGTMSNSLKVNQRYCVTFYVSLADSEWWATNSIGAYFSNDSICTGTYNVLSYTPQVENPATNFIIDKINWTPISGEYLSLGGEKFMTIGCFQNTTPSDVDSVGHGGFKHGENSEVQSAYYVDDVYVRMLTIANAGGKEDTICYGNEVMLGKDTTTAGVSFSWLPTTGLSNPNIAQPMASPTVTTTYTLTVVNDSIHGCNCADSVTKDSIIVFVYPAMNVTTYSVDDTGNNSGSAGVHVTGGATPYTYLWKPSGGTTDSITGLGGVTDTCIITDANGCTYTTKIIVKNTTGIANITTENEQISIFPNPNNGVFTIILQNANAPCQIEIYNVLGEKVYSQFSTFYSPLPIKLNQPNGVYFYRVVTENGRFFGSGKLLIEK